MHTRSSRAALVASMVIASLPFSSFADLTFIGTGTGTHVDLSASVTFKSVGNDLFITLDNTAEPGSTIDPSHLLTAVYFTIGTGTKFSSGSIFSSGAVWNYIPPTKSTKGHPGTAGYWTTITGADVGANWEYKGGLNSTPGGQNAGLSSTGLGIFDQNGNLTTGAPQPLAGPPWGISAGQPADTQSMRVNSPVVSNEIVFDLKGLGSLLATISNVGFQYGTTLSEPYLQGTLYNPTPPPPVPEPTTSIAAALLLLPLATSIFRVLRKRL